jgi:hypothetical protein
MSADAFHASASSYTLFGTEGGALVGNTMDFITPSSAHLETQPTEAFRNGQ